MTPTTVACGMAVSAGLLAAGCVASAAGYPALGMALINVLSSIPGFLVTWQGSCVRKGALFQGCQSGSKRIQFLAKWLVLNQHAGIAESLSC